MATPFSTLIRNARDVLNEQYALVVPGAPLVSPQGTPGAATWSYKITGTNATGETEASETGTTTTGNATLDGTNFNLLTWTAIPFATGYNIYRTVAGTSPTTLGLIGAATSPAFTDMGAAGDGSTPPTVNTSGVTNPFWTDAELLGWATKGVTDLWAAINDLNQEHFLAVDVSNVSLAANATQLSGVPASTFRVHLIEPRDTTSDGISRDVVFVPRDYNHPSFVAARAMSTYEPSSGLVIFYTVTGAGSPIAAPIILTAPKISSALTLRFVYVPVLAVTTYTTSTTNPIPGESDNALVAWIIAYARSKEREDRSPDPNWISVYATEKQSLLTRMTPRQTQEPDYVEGVFEAYWGI